MKTLTKNLEGITSSNKEVTGTDVENDKRAVDVRSTYTESEAKHKALEHAELMSTLSTVVTELQEIKQQLQYMTGEC